jgi:peptide/nickel transport system substrate-binding protein
VADSDQHATRGRRFVRIAAVAASLAIVTTAFASIGGASTGARAKHGAGGGGEVKFGLEAETEQANGFCLPRSQLAISGIQVAAAVYDTLMVPNSKGKFVPYLAKSVEPNADFTEWTIGLRDGVTFHDGTPVDAEAVKLNLDTFGLSGDARTAANPPQTAPLFSNVQKDTYGSSEVVDPLTVKVTLKQSVPGYPAWLYGTGRAGIVAPAQLNSGDACASTLIGSGPFKCEPGCWRPNESMSLVKNDDYWQKGLPKADKLTFVPVVEAAQRVTQLEGGQLDVIHTSSAKQIEQLDKKRSDFNLLIQKTGLREIRYYFVNAGKAPFSDPNARKALAMAIDRDRVNSIINKGLFQIADGIMDTRVPGYVKSAGVPKHNVKKAKQLVEKVKADNGSFSVDLLTTTDPENQQEAQLLKEQLDAVGIDSNIQPTDQATLINRALTGDYGMFLWRNLHGGNPNYPDVDLFPWFGKDSLVNFGKIKDDDLEALLKEGRNATSKSDLQRIYADVNKSISKNVYILPMWFVDWTIASQKSVKVQLPKLPDGGGKPLFVYGRIPVLGISNS